jgi:hypothetical protein
MSYLQQTIDRPLAARNEVLNTTGLVATPFTGVTSTAVLLWTGAAGFTGPQGAVQVPTWLTATNDANLGTVVTIFKPGVYSAFLYCQQVASVDITYGISADVVVGGLTAVPAFATAGMLAVARRVTIAGQTQVGITLAAEIMVSPEQSIAGSVVRFHATLSAGGAPAASQTAAAVWFRIRKVNDLHQ